MLDGLARRLIDPPLAFAGRRLVALGVGADFVTVIGLVTGLAAAGAIAIGHPLIGLALIALSRLCDGLDGAIARIAGKTDRGGFIDIVFDFVFYGAIPLAFGLAAPENLIAAAVLLFAFYVNGASFLAFAIFAAKRGIETNGRGEKSLYFTAGLAEGTETIAVFAAMCLFPGLFGPIALLFAALCLVTAAARIMLAWRTFN